jgi:hypothetical protein
MAAETSSAAAAAADDVWAAAAALAACSVEPTLVKFAAAEPNSSGAVITKDMWTPSKVPWNCRLVSTLDAVGTFNIRTADQVHMIPLEVTVGS